MSDIEHGKSGEPTVDVENSLRGYYRRAIVETSQELGGQDLALLAISFAERRITEVSDQGLVAMTVNNSEFVNRVMSKAEQIQQAQLRQDGGNFITRAFKRK